MAKVIDMQDIEDTPGPDEIVHKLLEGLPVEDVMANFTPEQRVAGLTPEQCLAGLTPEQIMASLTPEQRVAGLALEQVLLWLPDAILRGFSDESIATLSESARAAIRKRIGR